MCWCRFAAGTSLRSRRTAEIRLLNEHRSTFTTASYRSNVPGDDPSAKSQSTPSTSEAATSANIGGHKFRLAVVGSGPAGFYAASRILSSQGSENAQVHIYEELPVPFGLIRYGVAPDHPEVKNCIHKFEELAQDPRFQFFGNVEIGHPKQSVSQQQKNANGSICAPISHALHVPLSFLRQHYHAVLFTYGASQDRSLGPSVRNDEAPGLTNVLSARAFVHWYNGHPHSPFHEQGLHMDLSGLQHTIIVGQGNVALDCARILLSGKQPPTIERLSKTDTPESVLTALSESTMRHVDIVGRRGPLQFAGTTKEVRELVNLDSKHVGFYMSAEDRTAVNDGIHALDAFTSLGGKAENARMRKRLLQLMQKAKTSEQSNDLEKSWSLSFGKSPIAIEGSNEGGQSGPVRSVTFEHNELQPTSMATLPSNELADPTTFQARGTGETSTQSTDLLLKSVGYRSMGIEGLPFDNIRGVVRNEEGRVVDEDGSTLPGLYVSGWLARGPNGVIATTMYDAFQTAELIMRDFTGGSDQTQELPTISEAEHRAFGDQRVVSWQDWQAIDAEERKRGAALGKEREKLVRIRDMLAVLG